MRRLLAAALGTVLSGPAMADVWTIDGDTSALTFEGLQSGAPFEGRFNQFDADIRFDPGALGDSRVTVVVDTSSFSTDNEQRDSVATGEEWFSVDVFPEARFEVTAFSHVDGDSYEAVADLTIRDMTVSITLPFSLVIDGDTARMSGEVSLNRLDFGLGQGDWESDAMVGYPVRVSVDLTAVRAP